MNILFLSYWSITEGLTKSTVIPNVNILSSFENAGRILLVTIERDGHPIQPFNHAKIIHYPIYSRISPIPLMDKVIDFYRIPRVLNRLIRQFTIQKMIARGSPAGALAYLTWRRNRIPFYVESFEPHADYMIENGVWKGWDLRYLLLKKWEISQLKYASGIMPVSLNYEKKLRSDGYPGEKIVTASCAVDPDSFMFKKNDRKRIRQELGIGNRITGIYLGKFGGLYMDQEFLRMLEILIAYYKRFYLLILTPIPIPQIEKKISDLSGEKFDFSIHHVRHEEVSPFLSAADFGLASYKFFKSGQFLSPVKIGEYWASGLPVLLTRGVGDESYFIENEGGGALFDFNKPIPAFRKIERILKLENHRSRIPELALKYRSFDQVIKAYRKLIFS
jgi:glycosyltransferase involved in cell wall biosynthesis